MDVTAEELREAILDKRVRIDFGERLSIALDTGDAKMVDGAQVYIPGETRGGNFKWVKYGPVIVSDARLESLRTVLRGIARDDALPTVAEIAEFLDVMNPVESDNPQRHQIELVLMAIRGLADA